MMKRGIVFAAVIFAVTWLLWSGIYKPLILSFGVLSCAIVVVLASRMRFFDAEVYSLGLTPRLPAYWAWLIKEIIKSNIEVARIVLKPRLDVTPTIVTVDATDLPQVSQAVLANAITLTPGTLTMDINRGMIEVHCLTKEGAAELQEGEMVRRTRVMSGS